MSHSVAVFVQKQLPQVAADRLHASHPAPAVPVAGDAGVGFDAHDDLPQISRQPPSVRR